MSNSFTIWSYKNPIDFEKLPTYGKFSLLKLFSF